MFYYIKVEVIVLTITAVFTVYIQVGFMDGGKITALQIDLYSNAGMSLDLSWAVSNFTNINITTLIL